MLRIVRELVPAGAELGAKLLRPAELRAALTSVAGTSSARTASLPRHHWQKAWISAACT